MAGNHEAATLGRAQNDCVSGDHHHLGWDLEVRMKPFLLTLVTLALVSGAALAADATALAPDVDANCLPGMTAAVPGICSLRGYHWELTTHYLSHGEARADWMLLPNR